MGKKSLLSSSNTNLPWAQICPVTILKSLADDDSSFSQGVQRLLSGGGGGGFATWLSCLTRAALMAAKEGTIALDVPALKEAYSKVVCRLKQAKPTSAVKANQADEEIALAKVELMMRLKL